MKKLFMVISSGVNGTQDRKFYEDVEGRVFNKLADAVQFFDDARICSLSDFMDLLNDEEYPTDSWVTYIYINY